MISAFMPDPVDIINVYNENNPLKIVKKIKRTVVIHVNTMDHLKLAFNFHPINLIVVHVINDKYLCFT